METKTLAKLLESAEIQGKIVQLQLTGVEKKGAFIEAFECTDTDNQLYYLKIGKNSLQNNPETLALNRVAQIFKNEILNEPDPAKRNHYLPVPRIVSYDIKKFNPQFAAAFDSARYNVQLQTKAAGICAEEQLPDSLSARLQIALDFAKILRTCAKNNLAYVDVKPLEHIFWYKTDEKIKITLIDWGNAKINASPAALAEDLRAFCTFLPELIYHAKMLDFRNRGKFEYPIQTESNPILSALLGQFSVNAALTPLTQRSAQLIGEILSNGNEIRIRSRCIEVWDEILAALTFAVEHVEDNTTSDWQEQIADAETMIASTKNLVSECDFSSILQPRFRSLACYQAWLIPALRFVQVWYGKIDFVPNQAFDECLYSLINNKPEQALDTFEKLSHLIEKKISPADDAINQAELRQHLRNYLHKIRQIFQAWEVVFRYQSGEISAEDFLKLLNNSNLHLVDPLLAKLKAEISQVEPITDQTQESESESEASPLADCTEKIFLVADLHATPSLPAAVNKPLSLEIESQAEQLRSLFNQYQDFSVLLNYNFFNELDKILEKQEGERSASVTYQLTPIYKALIQAVKHWTEKTHPSKFFASDSALNEINWLLKIPPKVLDEQILDEKTLKTLSHAIEDALDVALDTLSGIHGDGKKQSGFQNKLLRIRFLRKKLDAENMKQMQFMLENQQFESVEKIMDAQYASAPDLFANLQEEINRRKSEIEDQNIIHLMNALLNDLYATSGQNDTVKSLKNPHNVVIANRKIAEFQKRTAQIFDVQEDLIRNRQTAIENRTAIRSLKKFLFPLLALSAGLVILLITILIYMLAGNASLEQKLTFLQTDAVQRHFESEAAFVALQRENSHFLSLADEIKQAVLTPQGILSAPLPEPTIYETPLTRETELAPTISEADAKLEELLEHEVTFSLEAGVAVYAGNDPELSAAIGQSANSFRILRATLLDFTDIGIKAEMKFNIARSQVDSTNLISIAESTRMREFSDVPSETVTVFVTRQIIGLSKPLIGCIDTRNASYCHGTLQVWLERSRIGEIE